MYSGISHIYIYIYVHIFDLKKTYDMCVFVNFSLTGLRWHLGRRESLQPILETVLKSSGSIVGFTDEMRR